MKKNSKNKQDPKLVAEKQLGELKFISSKYKVPMKVLRDVVKRVGRSRYKAVYPELRRLGYNIPERKKKI